MTTRPKNEGAYKISAEEVAAVKAGMADFAKGRCLTEEQFQEEMSRYLEQRQAKIESLRPAR